MKWWPEVVNILAALIVLAEALNKLERADLFGGQRGLLPRARGFLWLLMPWRWKRYRVVQVLKVCGWASISVGAAGELLHPLLGLRWPIPGTTAVIVGFALLIVRSRLKEG